MSSKSTHEEIDCNSESQLDKKECDQFCQKLVDILKLVAILQEDDRYFKYYSKHQERFELLRANVESLNVICPTVFEIFSLYDFRNVRSNGYRSYFKIIYRCLVQVELHINSYKSSYLVYRHINEQTMQEYTDCLNQLTIAAKYLTQLIIHNSNSRCLFMKRTENQTLYDEILDCNDRMECEVFYGECLGFYLCGSAQALAKLLCSIQLGLGQAMTLRRSKVETLVSTMVYGAHSYLLEHKRAEQMTKLYKQATVKFCKQFWNLPDNPILAQSVQYVLPTVKVVREIKLQPIGLEFQQIHDKGSIIRVSPPTAHLGHSVVNVRLLSSRLRPGMEWINSNIDKDAPQSRHLIFHIHGGGFVAQSSKSHDGYLRQWALSLACPIVSVDYSHAPEAPFPRAHEECLYAYCWCVKSLSELGCHPDTKILICGDSAGGNLVIGVILQLHRLKLPRQPSAAFLAYPATLVDFVPSPARMLGILDPILPIGVLARCLLAYGGVNEDYLMQTISTNSIDTLNNKESNIQKGSKAVDIIKSLDQTDCQTQNQSSNDPDNENNLEQMTAESNIPIFKLEISTNETNEVLTNADAESMNENKKDTKKKHPNGHRNQFFEEDTLNSRGETVFHSKASTISPIRLLENANLTQDPIMSPLIAEDFDLVDFPPVTICASEFDPLLDDSIEFCKRLSSANPKQKIDLKVMPDLPHGFLNMGTRITSECYHATQQCLQEIQALLKYISDDSPDDKQTGSEAEKGD